MINLKLVVNNLNNESSPSDLANINSELKAAEALVKSLSRKKNSLISSAMMKSQSEPEAKLEFALSQLDKNNISYSTKSETLSDSLVMTTVSITDSSNQIVYLKGINQESGKIAYILAIENSYYSTLDVNEAISNLDAQIERMNHYFKNELNEGTSLLVGNLVNQELSKRPVKPSESSNVIDKSALFQRKLAENNKDEIVMSDEELLFSGMLF